jgi:hypothetical protein
MYRDPGNAISSAIARKERHGKREMVLRLRVRRQVVCLGAGVGLTAARQCH